MTKRRLKQAPKSDRGHLLSGHIIYRAFTLPADLVQAVDGPFILAPRNDHQEFHAVWSVLVLIVLLCAISLAAVTA